MTTTTATAKPLTIPAAGLRFETATTTVTAKYVSAAGYKVEVRINGEYQPQLSSLHTFEDGRDGAINAYIARCDEADATAEQTEPAAPPAAPIVKLAPAAKGTQTRVSDPGHTALAIAHLTGHIERGGKPGQAPIGVLNALAKRGHVALTYQAGRRDARKVVTGAEITHAGRVALERLTAEDRAAAELAAALALTTIRTAA